MRAFATPEEYEKNMRERAAKKYFKTRPHWVGKELWSYWVAKDTWDGDWRGPGDFSLPMPPVNPPREEKKQVAVEVYRVIGEAPGHFYEVVLLAENEFNAIEAIKMTYGFTPSSCVKVKGPFKNGTILMMKQVKK